MRHRNTVKTLGRKTGPKKALMKGLAVQLIEHESIVTTHAKAKVLKPQIEKMVTKSRVPVDKSLAVRRELIARLGSRTAVSKLLSDIAPRFQKRPGGYTRIIKLPNRQGDGAAMAQIEFTAEPKKIEKTKNASTQSAEKKAPAKENSESKEKTKV